MCFAIMDGLMMFIATILPKVFEGIITTLCIQVHQSSERLPTYICAISWALSLSKLLLHSWMCEYWVRFCIQCFRFGKKHFIWCMLDFAGDRYWCCWLRDISGWEMSYQSQCGLTQYPIFHFTLMPSRSFLNSFLFVFFIKLSNGYYLSWILPTNSTHCFPIYMKNSLRGGGWWWLSHTGAFGKWVYRGNISIQHSKCTCNIPASYFANHLPSTKGENRQVGKHSHTGRDGNWLPCSYLHFSDTIPSTHSPQAHYFKNKFKAKSRWIRQTEPLFFFFPPLQSSSSSAVQICCVFFVS